MSQDDDVIMPDASTPPGVRLRTKLLVVIPILLVIGYFVAAFVVFDFSKAAFPFQQGSATDGRPMAFGPRPRPWLYPPHWEGVYWKGKEWPFVVFAPVCSWWRHSHGYAAPTDEG